MPSEQPVHLQPHITYRHAQLSDGKKGEKKALQIGVVSTAMVRLMGAPGELIQTFQAACKK